MEPLETHRGTVYPWEIDHMGHMNVQHYVARFDSATWHLFAAMGMTPRWLRDHRRGMSAVEQTVSYRREVLAGDLVIVISSVLEVSTRSIRFRHVMHDAVTGEEVASTELVGVHIDLERREAVAFSNSIRSRAKEMIALRDPTR